MARLLILTVIFSVLYISEGKACSCSLHEDVEKYYHSADVVMHVKVIGINDSLSSGYRGRTNYKFDKNYTDHGGYMPKLQVLKVLKGDFELSEYQLKQNFETSCDFYFKRDTEYIIFGYLVKGEVKLNRCTGNFEASEGDKYKEVIEVSNE